jgi:hypothetical protein
LQTKDSLDVVWSAFPKSYYRTIYQWDKLERLAQIRKDISDSSFVFYKNSPEFEIIFHKNIDTIPIQINHNIPFIQIEINGKLYWFVIDTGCMFTTVYKNEKLILRKPEKKENSNRNLFWFNVPIIQFYAAENAHPMLMFFDSGANITMFYKVAMQNILGINAEKLKTKSMKILTATGKYKSYHKILPKFSFYTICDNDVNLLTVKNGKLTEDFRFPHNIGICGLLGSDYFRNKSVRIDILNGIFEIME